MRPPSTSCDWIDRNVAFRLGDFALQQFYINLAAIKNSEQKLPKSLFFVDGLEKKFFNLANAQEAVLVNDKWRARTDYGYVGRACSVLNYFRYLPFSCDFGINMVDAQNCDYANLIDLDDHIPVFQHARLIGRKDIALFPLRYYMEPGGMSFPDSPNHEVPWNEKIPKIFWRGVFSGHVLNGGKPELANSVRATLIRSNASLDELTSSFSRFPRFKLVSCLETSDIIDAKFTGWEKLPDLMREHPAYASLLRHLHVADVPISQQVRYKYLIALEGNDYATSLPWSLATNSVVLRVTPHWETIFDESLRPWVHYVPVAEDLSDLGEVFEWCESHTAEVKEIISNANEYISLYQSIKLRNWADFATFEKYDSNFSKFGRFSDVGFGRCTD